MAGRLVQSGFVLILVLLALVILATVMVISGRRACQLALLAQARQEELQLKWGVISCRSALLPLAEYLIQSGREDPRRRPTARACRLTLSGMDFRMVLADEQAKANVNTLFRRRGESVSTVLTDLQLNNYCPLPVMLRPARLQGGRQPGEPAYAYSTPDHFLAYRSPRELVNVDQAENGPLARLTCWSDGRLNYLGADQASLRAVLEGLVDEQEMAALTRFRQENPDATVEEAFARLQLKPERAAVLRQYLTDFSTCFSLWIVAQGRVRQWYRLYISGDDQPGNSPGVLIW